ncbi:uncharacterized protein JCM6883_000920 [Sporobolomyces salmoneus]|uniref:uncharacterized protein n=1 Tax=Sporobolomyces salmoneus TaxID=183962 RepID=UPI00317D17D7
MTDANNLLSILRGEIPVPPLGASSSSSPSSPLSSLSRPLGPPPVQSSSPSNSQANKQDVNHLENLLSRLSTSSQGPSTPSPALVPSPPPPSKPTQSPGNSLLSILQGGKGPAHPSTPPVAATPPTMPNFNFVSPFDLLSLSFPPASPSTAAVAATRTISPPSAPTNRAPSVSPAPATPQRSAQSIPTNYLSYPSLPSTSSPSTSPTLQQGLRIPSSSLPSDPSSPQLLSISPSPGTHSDSLVTTRPDFVPITLFTPQLPDSRLGGSRRLAISESGIAYVVQQKSKSNGKKSRSSASSSGSGEGVRIIDRDSGARVLIEKPFGETETKEGETIEVSHVEASRRTENGGRAWLFAGGGKAGTVAVWVGKDRFEEPKGKDAGYQPRFIVKAPYRPEEKFAVARLHPDYPNTPLLAFATDREREYGREVWLVDMSEANGVLDSAAFGRYMSRHSTLCCQAFHKVRFKQFPVSLALSPEVVADFRYFLPAQSICDIAFSPDGSLVAVLEISCFSIFSTNSGHPILSATLPPSESIPSEITFLSSTPSTPLDPSSTSKPVVRGVAVSSRNGTQIDLFSFASPSSPPSSTASPVVSITLEPPTDDDDTANSHHSSQMSFNHSSSTLYVSSSLRGSIFAFKVSYPSLSLTNARYDLDVLERFLSDETPLVDPKTRSIRISHVLETPHPEPILQFVLDSKTPAAQSDEGGAGGGGALVLHSQGIQHMSLPPLPVSSGASKRPSVSAPPPLTSDKPSLSNPFSSDASTFPPSANARSVSPHSPTPSSPPTDSELDRYLEVGRRMSLEGSIHVQSEVEVEEERVDEVSWEFMRRASVPIVHEDEMEPNGVEEEEEEKDRQVEEILRARLEKEKVSVSADELGSIDEPVRGDIANASVFDPATLATPSAEDQEILLRPRSEESKPSKEEEIKLSGPVVNAAIKSMKAATAAKRTGGEGGPSFSNTYKNYSASATNQSPEADSSASTAFPVPQTPTTPLAQSPRIGTGNVQGGEKLLDEMKKLRNELPGSIEGIVSRQLETYLQRFEEDRSRERSSSTARAIQEAILPALEDIISAEVERSMENVAQKILPREISSVILDPDFTRSIAGSLVPTVEKTVTQLVLSGLVPSFKHTLRKSVDEIMHEMRGEMVGVRKEIVREQSGTVEKLEREVGGLKREVGELKGMLERMEKLIVDNQQAPRPPLPAVPVAAPVSASSSTSMNAFSPRSSSNRETLPPIPRSETPLANYEDILTTFLQPSDSPSFSSLVRFVERTPPGRLDRIFPPASSTGPTPPAISMAVTLSLAFRLSEIDMHRDGPFTPNEQVHLEWLKRAVGVCNDQQPPDVVALIPRILDSVLNHLVARGRKLMAMGDHRGAGEIRTVEQYARARLSIFA